jgi:hypothetical protein
MFMDFGLLLYVAKHVSIRVSPQTRHALVLNIIGEIIHDAVPSFS